MFKKNLNTYKNIRFTNTLKNDFFPPKPSSSNIPQWYKDTESYIDNKKEYVDGVLKHTIKKCMPVFDSITAGYMLFTQVDVEVSQNINNETFYNWPSQEPINFHSIKQAELHPYQNKNPYPKWMNPWIIETDPGYSCLFVNPLNNPNGIFNIIPGIVDTDKHLSTINFPFVLNDPNWSGIIPAGTPIVQIIPFKRESWKHTIGNDDDIKKSNISFEKLRLTIHSSYKKNFWSKKEYK
jgi:hypothetical protein